MGCRVGTALGAAVGAAWCSVANNSGIFRTFESSQHENTQGPSKAAHLHSCSDDFRGGLQDARYISAIFLVAKRTRPAQQWSCKIRIDGRRRGRETLTRWERCELSNMTLTKYSTIFV